MPNRHEIEHIKCCNVHLLHRMKQLSNISPSVSQLEAGIEPGSHRLAVHHSTNIGCNWGLGLGWGIGIGDLRLALGIGMGVGFGIGIGNWELGLGLRIGCEFWL